MNGLSMIPWPNQASLSARALSRSPDELGMKYLNHREETKASDTDSLFKTSTGSRSRRQITQPLTICKKRMHFSTHDQNWLPPPGISVSSSTALEFLTAQLCVPIRGSPAQNRWPAFQPEKWACVLFVTDLPVTRGHGDTTQQREQNEQERRQPQVMHHRLE